MLPCQLADIKHFNIFYLYNNSGLNLIFFKPFFYVNFAICIVLSAWPSPNQHAKYSIERKLSYIGTNKQSFKSWFFLKLWIHDFYLCVCDDSVEKWSRDSKQKPNHLTGGASSICQMGTKLLSKSRQTKHITGKEIMKILMHQLLKKIHNFLLYLSLSLRYVSVVVQWCDWVKQTEQSMSAVGVALSDSAHSDTPQPITCRY